MIVIYLQLFFGFLKVGLFSFGGAYGAISLIRDVVRSYGWLSDETLTYMIAVSESTPGPIMVNFATYIGSSQAGFLGALIATFAVVLPAFVIILLVMAVLENALKNCYVQAVLDGVKPCITGVILSTGLYMIVTNCISYGARVSFEIPSTIIFFVLSAILSVSRLLLKKKISPVMLIVISGVLGIIIYGF